MGARSAVSAVGATDVLAQDGGAAPSDPLAPDSVLAVPNGPVLVFEEAAGLPAAGIRISAPRGLGRLDDARALVALAIGRAQPLADLIGASLWGGLDGGRIAYQVIGDRRDIDELAWIVRILARRPSPQGLRAALARERARADRLAETPHGRVVAAIDSREFDSPAAPAARRGNVGFDEVSAFARIERLWMRSHARDRLRVVVLGGVEVPVALAELSLLGAKDQAAGREDEESAGAAAAGASSSAAPAGAGLPERPGAFLPPAPAWAGAFFSLGTRSRPGVLVAQDALAAGLGGLELPGVVLRVQHGLGSDARWTAVTATALAQRDADNALAAALGVMSEAQLAARWSAAAEAARRDLVAAAATPAGWLALADRWHGHPGSVRGVLARVEAAGRPELVAAVQAFESTLVRLGGGG